MKSSPLATLRFNESVWENLGMSASPEELSYSSPTTYNQSNNYAVVPFG